ncbi:hypothetical protein [Microbacterium profundi]|uniref:hypothetical protein n=1 Tax=Microbacterium profundi TaxID=450380 RepID=UPI000A4C7EA6|nr:hypothetical protein [Microbacterium profundi]
MTAAGLLLPVTGVRSAWLDLHHAIEAHDPTKPLVLNLPATLPDGGLSDYGLRMQAILTWGQRATRPVLRLADYEHGDDGTIFHDASDFHLVAASLAHGIFDRDGNEVTSDLIPLLRMALAMRRELPELSPAHLELGRHSIILASHLPRQSRSLDLHTKRDGTWGIEEESRTLYHDIWPEYGVDDSLRDPWMEQDEQLLPERAPTHIARTEWPVGHPLVEIGTPFTPLALRTLSPAGRALELATQTRVQQRRISDEVGEVLFELIQNTEWHGLPPQSGNGRGCRIVSFDVVRMQRSAVSALPETDSYFARYVEALLDDLTEDRSANTSVLLGVATVVDSGLGLARSAAAALKEEHLFSETNEVNYLIKALDKSVRVSRRAMGNIGLPRVQQLLSNLRGFMSIRTGRTEIHRDFVRNRFEDLSLPEGRARTSQFIDWVPDTYEDFVVGPRVGTDVTIMFPVAYERDGARL